MIKLSPTGRIWLTVLEGGPKLKAYQDNKCVWTIGIGSTYWPDTHQPIKEGDALFSKQHAEIMFSEVLKEFEEAVTEKLMVNDRYIRNGGPFAEHVTDALISFCFNIGIGAFRNASTAVKRFNKNFPISSVAEAMKWYRYPKLDSRRAAEVRCLLNGVYSDQAGRLTPAPEGA